nr:hyalin-like [Lytechinus pictus]
MVTWQEPTAIDHSGSVSQQSDIANGASFSIGPTTVTYTAVDASGNTALCSFIVTVIDDQSPVFTSCNTSTIYQSTDLGENYATVSWTLPTATDNDGTPTISSTSDPLDQFSLGQTLVVYTASDNSGNQVNCSFTVEVTDDEPPMFSGCLTAGVTTNLGSSQSFTSVSWATPTLSDNVMVAFNSSSATPGSIFFFGTTIVTYYANDTSGNEMRCLIPVNILDVTAPSLVTCPSTVTYNSSTYTPGQGPLFVAPNATDAVGIQSVTSNLGPYDNFTLGATTVTYVFKDLANLTTSCEFDVIVEDDENPTVDFCPTDQTLMFNSNGSSVITVTLMQPIFSDNSNNVTIESSHTNLTTLALGNHTITYTALDPSGNMAVCSFVITVEDTIPPVLSACPDDVILVLANGSSVANVTWSAPTASDNGEIAELVSSQQPPALFPIGVTTVTYTARDTAGLTSSCSFNVTIIDVESPVISDCPSNITVEVGPMDSTSNVSWVEPTANDNSNNVGLTSSHSPYSIFSIGDTDVTYTATDGSGNIDTCMFVITVLDNVNPVLTCKSAITIATDPGQATASNISSYNMATDNSGTPVLTSNLPMDEAGLGVTPVTITATDGSWNTAMCQFNITVVDNEGPTFTPCPEDMHLNTTNVASWTIPVASDNTGIIASSVFSHEPGVFPVGPTVVSYNATDQFGNFGTCQFTVTVDASGSPVVSGCPADISVNSSVGTFSANVTWVEPTATDSDAVNTTQSHYPGQLFPIGVTEVTYIFTDTTGRSTSCIFDITVILKWYKGDTVPPVFDFCPSNFIAYTEVGKGFTTVSWPEPIASDASGLPVTLSSDTVNGDIFQVYNYTVIYTAKDSVNNTAMCEFTFQVLEDFAPVMENCTSDISQDTDAGAANAMVTWLVPIGSDANGPVTTTANYSPGAIFPVGTTVVNYDVIDGTNNTANCTFSVTISDNEMPAFTFCPSDVNVYVQANETSGNVTWPLPVAVDNVGVVSLVTTSSQGTYNLGPVRVVYNAQDAAGNQEICSFTVQVIQDQIPTIEGCPDDITQSTDPAVNNASVSWTEPAVTDDRDNATISTDNYSPGDTFPIGSTAVMYTATDISGNTVTCSFTVLIRDEEDPVIVNCPMAITEYIPVSRLSCSDFASGSAFGIGATPVTYTATDSVARQKLATFRVTVQEILVLELSRNLYPVIYIALDASGNSATCSFIITVSEDQPPVISDCPSDQTVSTDAGQNYASISWTEPSATDDTGNVSVSISPSSTQYPLGTTPVIYTFTDAINLTSTCSFSVTVQGKLFAVNCIDYLLPASQLPVTVTWTAPSATDNTGNVSLSVNIESGMSFPEGTHEISYTATDSYGNSDTCLFSIIVAVDEPPTFTFCPSSINMATETGVDYSSVSWSPATATDDNGDATLSSDYQSGANFNIGTTTVTITAVDSAGSSSTCTFDVTVNDEENPVLSNCPSDITVYVSNSSESAIVTWTEPSVTDNSGESIVPSSNAASGASFGQGSTIVLYSATDSSQNLDTCSFVVIVQVATSLSQFEANLKLNRIQDQVGPYTSGDVTSSASKLRDDIRPDNLSADYILTLYFRDNVAVTETAIEGAFDAALVNNKFNVNNGVAQANDFYISPGACSSTPCQNFATCIDLNRVDFECTCTSAYTGTLCTDELCPADYCGNNGVCVITVGLQSLCICDTNFEGDQCEIHEQYVTHHYSDRSSRSSCCHRHCTLALCFFIMRASIDKESSNFIYSVEGGHENFTFGHTGCRGRMKGMQDDDVNIHQPMQTDEAMIQLIPEDLSESNDTSRNSKSVADVVRGLYEDQIPTIEGCPDDITQSTDPAVNNANEEDPVIVNCPMAITEYIPVSTTIMKVLKEISYTATDSYGNSDTCLFSIIVAVDEPPTLTFCPSSINMATETGASFGQGSTIVLYSATDSSQNLDTCSFVVIVQVATSLSQFEANLKLNRIQDQVGPYTSGDVTSSASKLRDDLENLFLNRAQSALLCWGSGSRHLTDPADNLSADYILTLLQRQCSCH